MSPFQRFVSSLVLACFVICSVAWTYDAYAGDDPLMSGQANESDEDGSPLPDSLPSLPGGGYCNLGCHLAGHLLGPVSSVIPVVSAVTCLISDRVFCAPRAQFLEPVVPPPISLSHV